MTSISAAENQDIKKLAQACEAVWHPSVDPRDRDTKATVAIRHALAILPGINARTISQPALETLLSALNLVLQSQLGDPILCAELKHQVTVLRQSMVQGRYGQGAVGSSAAAGHTAGAYAGIGQAGRSSAGSASSAHAAHAAHVAEGLLTADLVQKEIDGVKNNFLDELAQASLAIPTSKRGFLQRLTDAVQNLFGYDAQGERASSAINSASEAYGARYRDVIAQVLLRCTADEIKAKLRSVLEQRITQSGLVRAGAQGEISRYVEAAYASLLRGVSGDAANQLLARSHANMVSYCTTVEVFEAVCASAFASKDPDQLQELEHLPALAELQHRCVLDTRLTPRDLQTVLQRIDHARATMLAGLAEIAAADGAKVAEAEKLAKIQKASLAAQDTWLSKINALLQDIWSERHEGIASRLSQLDAINRGILSDKALLPEHRATCLAACSKADQTLQQAVETSEETRQHMEKVATQELEGFRELTVKGIEERAKKVGSMKDDLRAVQEILVDDRAAAASKCEYVQHVLLDAIDPSKHRKALYEKQLKAFTENVCNNTTAMVAAKRDQDVPALGKTIQEDTVLLREHKDACLKMVDETRAALSTIVEKSTKAQDTYLKKVQDLSGDLHSKTSAQITSLLKDLERLKSDIEGNDHLLRDHRDSCLRAAQNAFDAASGVLLASCEKRDQLLGTIGKHADTALSRRLSDVEASLDALQTIERTVDKDAVLLVDHRSDCASASHAGFGQLSAIRDASQAHRETTLTQIRDAQDVFTNPDRAGERVRMLPNDIALLLTNLDSIAQSMGTLPMFFEHAQACASMCQSGKTFLELVRASAQDRGVLLRQINSIAGAATSAATANTPWIERRADVAANVVLLENVDASIGTTPGLNGEDRARCKQACEIALASLRRTDATESCRFSFEERLNKIRNNHLDDDSAGIIGRNAALMELMRDVDAAMRPDAAKGARLLPDHGAQLLSECNDTAQAFSALVFTAQKKPAMYDKLERRGRQCLVQLRQMGVLSAAKHSEAQRVGMLDQIDRVTSGAAAGGVDNVLDGLVSGDPAWVRMVFGRDAFWDDFAKDILRAAHAGSATPEKIELMVATYDMFIAKRTLADFVRDALWKDMPEAMRKDANFDSVLFDYGTIRGIVHTLGKKTTAKVDVLFGHAILLEAAIEFGDPLLENPATRAIAQERLVAAGLDPDSLDDVRRFAQQGFKSLANVHKTIAIIQSFSKTLAERPDLADALRQAVMLRPEYKAAALLVRTAQNETGIRGIVAAGIKPQEAVVDSLRDNLGKAIKKIDGKLSVVTRLSGNLESQRAELAAANARIEQLSATLRDPRFKDVEGHTRGLRSNQQVVQFCTLHDAWVATSDVKEKAALQKQMEVLQRQLYNFSTSEGVRKKRGKLTHAFGSQLKPADKLLAYREKAELNVALLTARRELAGCQATAKKLGRQMAKSEKALAHVLGKSSKAVDLMFRATVLDELGGGEKRPVAAALHQICGEGAPGIAADVKAKARTVVVDAMLGALPPSLIGHKAQMRAFAEAFLDHMTKDGLAGSLAKWDAKTKVSDAIQELDDAVDALRKAPEHKELDEWLRNIEVADDTHKLLSSLENDAAFTVTLGKRLHVEGSVAFDPLGITSGTVNLDALRNNSVTISRHDKDPAPYKVTLKGERGANSTVGVSAILRCIEAKAGLGAGTAGGVVLSFNTLEECQVFTQQLLTNTVPDTVLHDVAIVEKVKGRWTSKTASVSISLPLPLGPLNDLISTVGGMLGKDDMDDLIPQPTLDIAYASRTEWTTTKNAITTRQVRTSEQETTVGVSGQVWDGLTGLTRHLCKGMSQDTKDNLAEGVTWAQQTVESHVYQHGYVTTDTSVERAITLDREDIAPFALATLLPKSMSDVAPDQHPGDGIAALRRKAKAGHEVVIKYQLTEDAALKINLLLAKGDSASRTEAARLLQDLDRSYAPASLVLRQEESAEAGGKKVDTRLGATYEETATGAYAHVIDTVVF